MQRIVPHIAWRSHRDFLSRRRLTFSSFFFIHSVNSQGADLFRCPLLCLLATSCFFRLSPQPLVFDNRRSGFGCLRQNMRMFFPRVTYCLTALLASYRLPARSRRYRIHFRIGVPRFFLQLLAFGVLSSESFFQLPLDRSLGIWASSLSRVDRGYLYPSHLALLGLRLARSFSLAGRFTVTPGLQRPLA